MLKKENKFIHSLNCLKERNKYGKIKAYDNYRNKT